MVGASDSKSIGRHPTAPLDFQTCGVGLERGSGKLAHDSGPILRQGALSWVVLLRCCSVVVCDGAPVNGERQTDNGNGQPNENQHIRVFRFGPRSIALPCSDCSESVISGLVLFWVVGNLFEKASKIRGLAAVFRVGIGAVLGVELACRPLASSTPAPWQLDASPLGDCMIHMVRAYSTIYAKIHALAYTSLFAYT